MKIIKNIIKAIKKRIAMKPLPAIEGMYTFKRCPTCRNALVFKNNYCDECGQKLDWEATDDVL